MHHEPPTLLVTYAAAATCIGAQHDSVGHGLVKQGCAPLAGPGRAAAMLCIQHRCYEESRLVMQAAT